MIEFAVRWQEEEEEDTMMERGREARGEELRGMFFFLIQLAFLSAVRM
jgi:hypothetical protein